jgi:hypothetical protein
MPASSELTHTPSTRSPNEVYGYPATAKVFRMLSDEGEMHLIHYGADPGVLFAKAPNGSIVVGDAGKLYVKNGAFGAANGSWVAQA